MNSYLVIATVCIFILSILVILIKKNRKAAEIETHVKPVFGSSFIQYWFAQGWEYERWISELTMLKNIGINEIILQNIADTKEKYAVYPTKIPGYRCNDTDMVGMVLKAADSLGLRVRIGLGFNSDWWTISSSNESWLAAEAQINKTIVSEIINMYGIHNSLGGWYIPYEINQTTAPTKTQQSCLNGFLKEIALEIKQYSKSDIMIAPFYSGGFSVPGSLPAWSEMIENVLKGTGIGIVALQDSVGAGFNKLRQLDNLYSYTKKATDVLGIKLYADTETFGVKLSENVSASQNRISDQLLIESKYVDGFVAFSINHYQNRNIEEQKRNYNDYYNYYLVNK